MLHSTQHHRGKDKHLKNMTFPDPPNTFIQPARSPKDRNNSIEGIEIRDCLKTYLAKNFLLRDV